MNRTRIERIRNGLSNGEDMNSWKKYYPEDYSQAKKERITDLADDLPDESADDLPDENAEVSEEGNVEGIEGGAEKSS